ncbi:MAG: heme-binding protein [Pseudomonadota bacterium]
MNGIRYEHARRIVDESLRRARSLSLQPLTVAVLDAGGHLVALGREDGSGLLRPQIAIGKAWGALGMGRGSRELAKRAESHPAFVQALTVASEGRIFPVAGGVLIRDASDQLLGAVGISGDGPDKDELCAIAGIEAVALRADPG